MIRATTTDNQEFYFKNFLDCLRYFVANGNERATKKDVNYSKHHASFIRANFKYQFTFAFVEKVEGDKLVIYRIKKKLFIKKGLLLVPFS